MAMLNRVNNSPGNHIDAVDHAVGPTESLKRPLVLIQPLGIHLHALAQQQASICAKKFRPALVAKVLEVLIQRLVVLSPPNKSEAPCPGV